MADRKNLIIEIQAEATEAQGVIASVSGQLGEVSQSISVNNKELEKLAEPTTVTVKANAADAVQKVNQVKKALKETAAETQKPPGGFFARLKAQMQGAVDKSKSMKKGMEELGGATSFLTPIGAAMAVGNLLMQVGTKITGHYVAKLRETGEQARELTAQYEKLAAIKEESRKADLSSIAELQALSQVESLSNTQKAEAEALIKRLTNAYGDLGMSIDSTSGKIRGLDGAQTAILTQQRDQRIKELQRQIAQMKSDIEGYNDTISGNGFYKQNIIWSQDGRDQVKEAEQRIPELTEKLMDANRRLAELKKIDPEKDRQLGADALLGMEREKLRIQQLRTTGLTEEADKAEFMNQLIASGKDLLEAEREALWGINQALQDEKRAQEELTKKKAEQQAVEDEIKRNAEARKKTLDEILSQADYEKQLAELRAKGLDDEATRLSVIEELRKRGIADEEEINRIMEVRKDATEATQLADSRAYAKDVISDAEYQLELQRLKNAGLDDEIDRLELMRELKEKNLQLTDDEIVKILASRKELRELQKPVDQEIGSRKTDTGRSDVDSLTKVGLYNFGKQSVSTLDKERNALLGDIKELLKQKPRSGGSLW